MKQAGRGLGGWRLIILMLGLVSMVVVALPAQAGLGDLLDDLLDPVEDVPVVGDIVSPIVEDLVDPIVEDVVEPVTGGLVDPIVEEVLAPVLTPIIDTVSTPIVDEVVTPVLDNVVPPIVEPVVETIPPVETTTTAPAVGTFPQEQGAGQSAGSGVSASGYPGAGLVGIPSNGGEASALLGTRELQSLEAALALQTALVDTGSAELSNLASTSTTEVEMADAGWLNGLTNWLRTSADGLLNLLALPIHLLELLARALLTAGSGLIAPLSMLLAFTAVLIKDGRWGHAQV